MTRGAYRLVACSNALLLAVLLPLAGPDAATVRADDLLPTADPPPRPAAAEDPLDQRLLDSLEADLLQGLPELPARSGRQPPRSGEAADPAAGEERPLGRAAGEDLGQEVEDPLVRISRRMREAQTLLAQQATAEPTQQLQEEILDDLRRLIDQLQQQCQGGGSASPQAKPGKPTEKPGQASRKGSGENTGSNKPSPDSTDRVGQADRGGDEWERMQGALKQVWGHLPERVRQQMQSGMAEEFLPKYEELIGRYYSRLAEDPE